MEDTSEDINAAAKKIIKEIVDVIKTTDFHDIMIEFTGFNGFFKIFSAKIYNNKDTITMKNTVPDNRAINKIEIDFLGFHGESSQKSFFENAVGNFNLLNDSIAGLPLSQLRYLNSLFIKLLKNIDDAFLRKNGGSGNLRLIYQQEKKSVNLYFSNNHNIIHNSEFKREKIKKLKENFILKLVDFFEDLQKNLRILRSFDAVCFDNNEGYLLKNNSLSRIYIKYKDSDSKIIQNFYDFSRHVALQLKADDDNVKFAVCVNLKNIDKSEYYISDYIVDNVPHKSFNVILPVS